MKHHNYTASDIHKMRNAIKLWGFDLESNYREHERAMEIETRLVTYLSQGIEPDDLIQNLAQEDEARHQHYLRINHADEY